VGAGSKIAAWLNKWRWILGIIGLFGLTLLFRKLLADETFLTGPSNAGQWIGRKNYLLTQPSVLIFYYLKLILFPINLNIDPHITMVSQWAALRFWSPFLVIIGSILLAFRYSQSRLFFFCVAWYFIVASPSSSIVTLLDLAAEHRIYLAGLGPIWILSLAWLHGIKLFSQSKSQKGFLNATGFALTALILVSLSGLTLLRVEVWQTPFRLWQDALKKSPNTYRPHNNLGKAYYERKDPETAVQHFRKSIALEPLHPEPHYNLASVLLDFGRNGEAEKEYRAAIRSNPDYYQAHLGLGSALVQNGLPNEAIESFQKAIESHQRVTDHLAYPVAHLNIGEALARQGRYPDAIREWQIAVQQQSSLIEAHYNLGTVWLITGELKFAEQAFLTCLKLDTGFDRAHFNLARVYQKQKLWDRANDHMQTFINQKGPHAGAYFEMAVNHQQAGRYNEAESYYRKSIDLDSGHLYANLNLGHLLMGKGKKDLAKAQLQRALSLNPPKNLGAEIKQLLEELERP
jgi:tetratricopeptide (TPR) repeat protein